MTGKIDSEAVALGALTEMYIERPDFYTPAQVHAKTPGLSIDTVRRQLRGSSCTVEGYSSQGNSKGYQPTALYLRAMILSLREDREQLRYDARRNAERIWAAGES